ncbi:MAG: polysaccharide deacetylase [Ruminococcaceae bacterium]|nr:polysaccharide deacetylase [Oscillospiraceae bacterium]
MMMYMRFPSAKKKALTFSYDDGVEQDICLMELFNKYGLKGTFNLNGGRLEKETYTYPAGTIHRPMGRKLALETYGGELGKNHEIAVHSYTHPFLDRVPRNVATWEITKDREMLENTFGRVVRGCAYPMGTFNDMTVEVLRNCGIAYARTTVSTGNFAVPHDWLRMPATCHHNDERLFSLADTFVSAQPNVWVDPWLFYLWGHAYEFENDNNWDRIEAFCEKVANRDDVWYATNIEIYDYVEAYRALQFSADFRMVRNPSALTVWFDYDGGSVIVNPGETIQFR